MSNLQSLELNIKHNHLYKFNQNIEIILNSTKQLNSLINLKYTIHDSEKI